MSLDAVPNNSSGSKNSTATTSTADGWVSVTDREIPANAAIITSWDAPTTSSGAATGRHLLGTTPSYDLDTLLRLNRRQADVTRARDVLEHSRKEMERVLEERKVLTLRRNVSQNKARLLSYRRDLEARKQALEAEQRAIQSVRRRIKDRRKSLCDAHARCATGHGFLEDNVHVLEDNKQTLCLTRREVRLRIADIAEHLDYIYPITPVRTGLNSSRILGVPLPNSEFTGAEPDQHLSTALGYVAHLSLLIATYLEIPLRYPLRPCGSRSTVSDPVSIAPGPREHPLFAKGTDKMRFRYGVYLLNKNIEQLLNFQGITILDLRRTLPNLSLLVTCVKQAAVAGAPSTTSSSLEEASSNSPLAPASSALTSALGSAQEIET